MSRCIIELGLAFLFGHGAPAALAASIYQVTYLLHILIEHGHVKALNLELIIIK